MSLLATYLRPQWPRAVLLGLLLFAGIGLQLANPQIAKLFIDQAHAGEPFERLVWIALLFLGVAVLTQATTVAETYVAENLGWQTTNALRADLARHVLDLDAAFHTEHGPGELIERIDGDVSALAEFFARFVVQVVGSGVFLLGILVLLFREDWRVGALLTAFALAALLFMTRRGGFVTSRSRAARQAAANLSAYLEERLAGLADLKTSGADAYVVHRLDERLVAQFRAVGRSAMAGSLFNASIGLIFVFGTLAALALSALLLASGSISLGTVYVVFRYTGMLRPPLERLARHMNAFLTATGAIARINELRSTQARITDGACATLPPGALSVHLEQVSFAYEADVVLQRISCCVQPGQVLGLLGRTGSGKTTLSRLLFRLHDVTQGTVKLGGVDVRHVALDALRQRVGLVTQDVQLLQGTVRDNVTLFDPSVPDERVRAVFRELGLDAWLEQLPAGLDTRLGAGGRGLSAGEAQLVALARVFLKDPGLVVLDEASSRLDPHTERLLECAISRLLAGRTGVVIAHRLTTVERADTILILQAGRVAECGPRLELERNPASRFSKLRRVGLQEVMA